LAQNGLLCAKLPLYDYCGGLVNVVVRASDL